MKGGWTRHSHGGRPFVERGGEGDIAIQLADHRGSTLGLVISARTYP